MGRGAFLAASPWRQSGSDGLAVGRQLLAEDNLENSGSKSLAAFPRKTRPEEGFARALRLLPGSRQGRQGFAQLPRYFADTQGVEDLESRLMAYIVELQGFPREDIARTPLARLTKIGTWKRWQVSSVQVERHENERAPSPRPRIRKLQNGRIPFPQAQRSAGLSCATCHSEERKRIRLQDLPNMTDATQLPAAVSTGWPAYRGTQSTVRTMRHRLYDCTGRCACQIWVMYPTCPFALTTYVNYRGHGGVIQLPRCSAMTWPKPLSRARNRLHTWWSTS